MERSELEGMLLSELHEVAADVGVGGYRSLRKEELIARILEQSTDQANGVEPDAIGNFQDDDAEAEFDQEEDEEPAVPEPIKADEFWESEPEPVEAEASEETCTGTLDIRPEGYGLLRISEIAESKDDIYISASQIRRLALRRGDEISGPLRAPRRGEKHAALRRVDLINGVEADSVGEIARFESLKAAHPSEPLKLKLGRGSSKDLKQLDSIKKGDRVLITVASGTDISPVVTDLAKAVVDGTDASEVLILLVDTPPERAIDLEGLEGVNIADVSYDHARKNQRQRAEFVLERCKRLIERGKDAVLIVDCMTDLGRAYGSDLTAVHRAKRFFGSGRCIKDGKGSLTVVASVREDSDLPSDRAMLQDLLSIASVTVRVEKEV